MQIKDLFLQVFTILESGQTAEFTLILNGETFRYVVTLGESNLCTLYGGNSRLIILDRELLHESEGAKLFCLAHEVGHTFNINTKINRWSLANYTKHPKLTALIRDFYTSYINSLRLSCAKQGKVFNKEIEADRYASELFPDAVTDAFEYFKKFVNKAAYANENTRMLSLKEIELRKELLL